MVADSVLFLLGHLLVETLGRDIFFAEYFGTCLIIIGLKSRGALEGCVGPVTSL